MKTSAIKRATEVAGGQTSLAKLIGVSQGLVWQWCNGAAIATRHFAAIERATKITASELLADEMAKSTPAVAAVLSKPANLRKDVAGNVSVLHGTESSRKADALKTPHKKGAKGEVAHG